MAKKSKNVVVIDFSKEEGGGGRVRVPEGDYLAKILGGKRGTSKSSGNPMVTLQFVGTKGKLKGKEFRDYFPLSNNMLWKIRQVLEATGQSVPKSKLKIDLDALKGKTVGVTMEDDEDDNGKVRSRPADYVDPDDVGTVKASKKDDADDGYDKLSRAKLEKAAKKKKVKFKAADSDAKLIKKLRKADEDVDDIDLDEEM